MYKEACPQITEKWLFDFTNMIFKELDTNKDGKVSWEEFQKSALAKLEERLA